MFAPAIIITLVALLVAVIFWSDDLRYRERNGVLARAAYLVIGWAWALNVFFVYLPA